MKAIIEELKKMGNSIKENKRLVNSAISKLPEEEKKMYRGIMKDMDNAFKKKDVDLLNGVINKMGNITKNGNKVS